MLLVLKSFFLYLIVNLIIIIYLFIFIFRGDDIGTTDISLLRYFATLFNFIDKSAVKRYVIYSCFIEYTKMQNKDYFLFKFNILIDFIFRL